MAANYSERIHIAGTHSAWQENLLGGGGELSLDSDFVSHVRNLCSRGLESLIVEHFLCSVEVSAHFIFIYPSERNQIDGWGVKEDYSADEISFAAGTFEKMGHQGFGSILMSTEILQFLIWKINIFCMFGNSLSCNLLDQQSAMQDILHKALEEIISEKQYQGKCLLMLVHALEMCRGNDGMDLDCKTAEMDIDGAHHHKSTLGNNKLVRNIGVVVRDLRSLGFTSIAEDAYASAIFLLLKSKVRELAGDEFRFSVLESIKGFKNEIASTGLRIKDHVEYLHSAVPLQFLHAPCLLGESKSYESPSSGLKSPLASHLSFTHYGTGIPSEGLVRWQLRLEYFAYETLQDLRIAKLFEIIVDYPDSSPAIEDLKLCLEYTGQHSKLVDSFIAALKYRLLTAGASTNDILHQYVSTIKALRTIDPAGVFLEAVGEPIREYLRGRKDTIKCIVTMLTDGAGGNPSGPGSTGDSLLEELNRDEENQENSSLDDDANTDDKQAWMNAQSWEPDPVEADSLKGGRYRRKVDILGMIVSIIGSKDHLVNEYRVMLAEKLLNKSDYDIDSEIRTLELLKIHFGESSMQKCEIMLNDLIDSKRTNTNIKATLKLQPQPVADVGEHELSLDNLNATIISSNFWPPIQDEALNIPGPVDRLLSDYAKRFNEIKTPRKLLWKKNLGTVKLELQFEDRTLQFSVTPLHASIISQFEDQTSWTSKNLAAAVGVPVDVLNRRIYFWINKNQYKSGDHKFTLVEALVESGKTPVNTGSYEELLVGDEEGETSVASVEDQLRKEMTVYEKFITGMLTNFGSMALDRIHNTLKMFCIGDPPYDKSLQQLQGFLVGLVAEEKLELRDGMYFLKK
ncbi:Anaphase-promoting complex subunit [Sesamum angolense]|uniref:Anaphase-promoting complex subunit 2 n=1 Tax=Sesamum angolense TaxID=2727404 RepID=A0AAE1X0R9_9LAMI|nr:Anaphase-promoting complex subunit [Sesamum angolense]